MKSTARLKSLFILLFLTTLQAWAQQKAYRISMTVSERDSHEAVIMGTVSLKPLGAMTVTDIDGRATINNVPKGDYTLTVSYVGCQTLEKRLHVEGDLELKLQLVPTSLAIKEVTVTAKQNASGTSTSSIIGRQAIDHLQATSLADVMQLIPGQLMRMPDLTTQQNLQLRSLTNDNTSAFGASIVVDGVAMSNNATLQAGAFSQTTFTGTDLRQVSADDIDQVEVVRGIPSAEYGDLTSGLVVVHSKVGITPWQVKGKISPGQMNYSLSKGLRLGGKGGVMNMSLDYAQAWGDPRYKTRSFHRYNLSAGYGYDPTPRFHTTTKLRFSSGLDWSGADKDLKQTGSESRSLNSNLSLTHNGRLQLDKMFARSVNYTVGLTLGRQDQKNTGYVATQSGLLPIITARETGYYSVPFMRTSYLATGYTEGRPGSLSVKGSNSFFLRKGKTMQSFKMGAEYHYDWNSGRGFYNDNELQPYKTTNNGRPRPFNDVPGLHQIAAFAEDAFTLELNKVQRLKVQLGLRLTAMQPFSNVSTTSLSPRLNASMSLTKWLELRAGIGMNSKTPGLAYIYPDKKYDDKEVANYFPNNTEEQLLMYHTEVYNVEYSRNLKNATTTKLEGGLDLKLGNNRRLSILGYIDMTPNGFGNVTDYYVYPINVFTLAHGLVTSPGAATTVDFSDPDPERGGLVFLSTGMVGNTNKAVNRGIEFDFDFGRIKPLSTSVYLSGAYSSTQTWSTRLNAQSVPASLLPSRYTELDLTPFKIVYPSELDKSHYRRFVATLRTVTNIPILRMVASLTAQAILYNYSKTDNPYREPIGWIDTNLDQHSLSHEQLTGYLGIDGNYYATQPANLHSVSLARLIVNPNDNIPTKSPITWNTSLRLTKELGKVGGFSFFANNALFYEPFLTTSTSKSLQQRNTGTFSYGLELYFNL